MSSYLWKALQKSWNFKLPSVRLGFFFIPGRFYSHSLGCWLQIAPRDIQDHAAPIATITRSPLLLYPSPFNFQDSEIQNRQDGTKVQYLPLEKSEIWLFTLYPGAHGDSISSHIQHCSWGYRSSTRFEALSYVWGDFEDSTIILADDCIITVTKSLYTALRHLRYPDKSRTLWVDYICINQEDVVERNHQDAQMESILRAC